LASRRRLCLGRRRLHVPQISPALIAEPAAGLIHGPAVGTLDHLTLPHVLRRSGHSPGVRPVMCVAGREA
jgi:hypothetical protein